MAAKMRTDHSGMHWFWTNCDAGGLCHWRNRSFGWLKHLRRRLKILLTALGRTQRCHSSKANWPIKDVMVS